MRDSKEEKFLKKYEKNQTLYGEMLEEIKGICEKEIEGKGFNIQGMKFRLKKRESLKKKISDKGKKYQRLTDITDIIGVRIITAMDDEVDMVAAKIEELFEVDLENTIDKRKVQDPRTFGYVSLHYVVKFKENKYKGIKFEIQIRSLLQHTWAEIEHDLGYKSRVGIPDNLVRSFSRVASLLELADQEFVQIKKELFKYEKNVHETISLGRKMDSKTPINNITMRYFLEQSKRFQEIYEEVVEKTNLEMVVSDGNPMETIKLLNYFKIKTMGKVEKSLEENLDELIFVTKKIARERRENSIEKRELFYSLAYVLLGKSPLSERLKFLEMFKVLTNSERRIMAKKMESYNKEYSKLSKKGIKTSIKDILFKNKRKDNEKS